MKTIRKLVKKFRRMYPEYEIWLNELESHEGYYLVHITAPEGIGTCYTFTSCKEFDDWMWDVVLD